MNQKVLLISHNALCKRNNMGRTLENQFQKFGSDEIAQLYFSDEKPESAYCKEYFCIPDSEVFRSIWTRREAGFEIELSDAGEERIPVAKDQQIKTAIRKKGNRRPLIYFLRNTIWKLGKWKTKKLDRWLDKVSPDVIYFASGDYVFSYIVTMYIAEKRKLPVIVGCYDDFYVGKKKTLSPLYHLVYADLMRHARRIFDDSRTFMGLSDMMTEEYSALFGKEGYTMYVPAELEAEHCASEREKKIFYAGNLGHGRAEQLVLLGRALKDLQIEGMEFLDVYSGEIREELTDLMSEENGIRFHGKVSPEAVHEMMLHSQYVVHTESFEEEYKKRVKYSVSTKIADCLASGACIVAFGPLDVASISYLKKANAAWVISDASEAKEKLSELFRDDALQDDLIVCAKALAVKHHNREKNSETFKAIILESEA